MYLGKPHAASVDDLILDAAFNDDALVVIENRHHLAGRIPTADVESDPAPARLEQLLAAYVHAGGHRSTVRFVAPE